MARLQYQNNFSRLISAVRRQKTMNYSHLYLVGSLIQLENPCQKIVTSFVIIQSNFVLMSRLVNKLLTNVLLYRSFSVSFLVYTYPTLLVFFRNNCQIFCKLLKKPKSPKEYKLHYSVRATKPEGHHNDPAIYVSRTKKIPKWAIYKSSQQ